MAIYGQMAGKVSGDNNVTESTTDDDDEEKDLSDFDVSMEKMNDSIEDILQERFEKKDKHSEEPHFTLATSHTKRDSE